MKSKEEFYFSFFSLLDLHIFADWRVMSERWKTRLWNVNEKVVFEYRVHERVRTDDFLFLGILKIHKIWMRDADGEKCEKRESSDCDRSRKRDNVKDFFPSDLWKRSAFITCSGLTTLTKCFWWISDGNKQRWWWWNFLNTIKILLQLFTYNYTRHQQDNFLKTKSN